jgi:hypothetical protein
MQRNRKRRNRNRYYDAGDLAVHNTCYQSFLQTSLVLQMSYLLILYR